MATVSAELRSHSHHLLRDAVTMFLEDGSDNSVIRQLIGRGVTLGGIMRSLM